MPGETISHYHIVEKLGAGGMGVVYRAEDLKLGRSVALKFLPDELIQDQISLARFEREARAAAAINHPNICTIYEVGEHEGHPFLAMELLEGATLRQRMGNKPLALEALLDWTLQIAGGLEAAHARGVVHRDIKPSNVFIVGPVSGYAGQAKILDFGLAKPASRLGVEAEQTVTMAAHTLTPAGAAAGTPAYMSPEQIRGEELDARTDLFSLGIVLYEMATGRAPFQGKTPGAVLGAVLHETPEPPSRLNPQLPLELERIINKALEKDRDIRYQHASDLRADLARLNRDTESARLFPAPLVTGMPAQLGRRRAILPLGLAGLAPAVVLAFLWFTRPLPPPRVTGTVQITSDGLRKGQFSTDGSRLYYVAGTSSAGLKFFQTSTKGGEPVPMPQLNGMFPLDVSPDGSELLMMKPAVPTAASDYPLWVASTLGSAPLQLGDLKTAYDARWSPKGDQIVYGTATELRIARGDGGDSRKLAAVSGVPTSMCWSPDGRSIRFTLFSKGSLTLWEVRADGSHLHPLFPAWTDGWQQYGSWTPDAKYFVFSDASDIWAWRNNRRFFGANRNMPVRLTTGPMQAVYPKLSPDGKRVFFCGILQRGELVRYDSKADRWAPYLSGLAATELDYSHDGKWLTYINYPGDAVWRSAADGSQRVQLTAAPLEASGPKWSPDGTEIAFFGRLSGKPNRVYIVPAAGGTVQTLTNGESGTAGDTNPDWSPDGATLVFSAHPMHSASQPDRAVLRIVNAQTHRVSILPGSEGLWAPRWSPDGRYIAALAFPKTKMMLYNVETHAQTELADLNAGWPSWSRDSQFVYFTDQWREWCRVRIKDRKLGRLASLKNLRLAPSGVGWLGLAGDDSLICTRDTSSSEIYALDWEAP